jgi:hypothetical protein
MRPGGDWDWRSAVSDPGATNRRINSFTTCWNLQQLIGLTVNHHGGGNLLTNNIDGRQAMPETDSAPKINLCGYVDPNGQTGVAFLRPGLQQNSVAFIGAGKTFRHDPKSGKSNKRQVFVSVSALTTITGVA